jgi:hypothetical protein
MFQISVLVSLRIFPTLSTAPNTRNLFKYNEFHKIRHLLYCGAVGIATCYRLNIRGVGVRVTEGQEFSLLYIAQGSLEVQLPSHAMANRTSLPDGKAARVLS